MVFVAGGMVFVAGGAVFVVGETVFVMDSAVSLQNRRPPARLPRYVFAAFG